MVGQVPAVNADQKGTIASTIDGVPMDARTGSGVGIVLMGIVECFPAPIVEEPSYPVFAG